MTALLLVSSASAGVRSLASLSLASGQVPDGIGPVSASSGFVVAGALGNAYVFTRPAGGWVDEHESAVLIDSAGASLEPTGIEVSGGTVVANEHLFSPDLSYEDVFVRPPGGWSGTVHEAARLEASDGAVLYTPSVSGSTVVAVGVAPRTQVWSAYVFREPAGGWSGTVHEVARLHGPSGVVTPAVSSAAVSGRTVVVAHGSEAGVYSEPATGWSSSSKPVAQLTAYLFATPVRIVGNVVVAGHDVFSKPSGGWRGRIEPSGQVVPVGGSDGETWPPCNAASASTVACTTYQLGSEHNCPCDGTVWVFSRPPGGWTGAVLAEPVVGTVTNTGPVPIAVDDQTLFTAGGSTVDVFAITRPVGKRVGPPTVSRPTVSGLRTGRPRLGLTLSSAANAPPIASLSLALPRGLAFSGRRDQLTRGVRVNGAHPLGLQLEHGVLTISSNRPRPRLSVAIGGQALRESSALIHRVIHAGRHHRAVRLALKATVTQAYDLTTHITFVLKLR